jgi:mRNA interferase MazF
MPIFERGSVVRVPFPYTDRPVRQHRPAVVVSSAEFSGSPHLLWVVMITSAENRTWPGDILLLANYRDVGLPAASLIRTVKIATIEAASAQILGILPADLLARIDKNLKTTLAI